MANDLTRGGLSPATLTNQSDNTVVQFHFNPYEYALSKSNTWKDVPVTGLNAPILVFQSGGSRTLSLKLHFDTQDTGSDVRGITQDLWDMVMIVESEKNALSGKSEPPVVVFTWGVLNFKAIITSLNEKLSLFSPEGTPLRSEVDISLQEYIDTANLNEDQIQEVEDALAEPEQPLIQGLRLDQLAGMSGGNHRNIANQNNIDNPLNVPPGTPIKTS